MVVAAERGPLARRYGDGQRGGFTHSEPLRPTPPIPRGCTVQSTGKAIERVFET